MVKWMRISTWTHLLSSLEIYDREGTSRTEKMPEHSPSAGLVHISKEESGHYVISPTD